jgi:hypothetical protein
MKSKYFSSGNFIKEIQGQSVQPYLGDKVDELNNYLMTWVINNMGWIKAANFQINIYDNNGDSINLSTNGKKPIGKIVKFTKV